MAATLEFFFDFMSPYSYLASTQVAGVAARTGADLRLRPLYLPGVMRATGNKSPIETPSKALYTLKDLNDWARRYGLPQLVMPDVFPFQAAQACRVALAVGEAAADKQLRFVEELFKKTWQEKLDPNSPAVLGSLLSALGLDAGALLAAAQGEAMKAKLRANTDEAVERGAFGVPTFFVNGELFVGNDRLPFVEAAARELQPATKGKDDMTPRFARDSAALLVIDVQERLCAAMEDAALARVKNRVCAAIAGAQAMNIPVVVTEQYPKGLGPTLKEVKALFAAFAPVEKVEFSGWLPQVREQLTGRSQVLVMGMEAHVCVFQTTRDLVQAGLTVYVAEDAIISRSPVDRAAGVRLCEKAGALITTVEAALFDALGKAGSPEFKAVSNAVK